jgi:pimeloyl-ACP methyl ester carboxylesterase
MLDRMMLRSRPHMLARLAGTCLLVLAAAAATVEARQGSTSSHLLVYVNGVAMGAEDSTLERTPEGWSITGSGRLSPPIDLTTRRFHVRYDQAWKPIELTVDGTAKGSGFSVHTTFTGTTAESDLVQQGQPSKKTDTVAADTIVLPNLFFSGYEALAMRLSGMAADEGSFAAYITPQAEIGVQAKRLDTQAIETSRGTVHAHRYALRFANPGGALASELWTDDAGRFLRLEVPTQSLAVIRDDIGAVTARRQNISRPGDEPASILSNGFNLAGTTSKPTGAGDKKGRHPAVILIAGSGPQDRDETVAGIPIFGQLAGSLADAGFLVLRYDKRGVGQSGGRADSADLYDYADDAVAAFRFLERRKDVDRDRIALLGHSEGALVALVAASRQKDVAAIVLAAGPSGTGAELVLEQQKYLLGTMSLSDADKQARVDLQKRIQAAVLGQGEWKDVPPELRRQADTQWFRTFLAFSPAAIMKKVRQPILVLQGELDKQVLPYHADKLVELASARKKEPADAVKLVKLPGINHLLVPATTGDVSEYESLATQRVSPQVATAAIEWLQAQFGKKR